MADVEPLYLPVPHEGVDLSQPASALPPARTQDLANYLVHNEGRLPLRGPILFNTAIQADQMVDAVGTPLADPVAGFAVRASNTKALLSGWQPGDGNRLPWRFFDLGAPGGTTSAMGAVILQGGTAAGIGTPASQGPGPAATRYQSLLWYLEAIGWSAVPTVTYQGVAHPQRTLYSYNPTTNALAISAEGPHAAQALANYAERLWVLGGTAPSAVFPSVDPLRPHSLWHTNPDQDPTVLASWRTSGVANQILVGREDPADWGLQLATAERYLLILKRHSTWVLTGSGRETFSVRQVSESQGVVDPRAVVTIDQDTYFMSDNGLWKFDGAELNKVSGPVDPPLQLVLSRYLTAGGPDSSFVRLQDLGNGYLGVVVGAQRVRAADVAATYFSAMYHTLTGRWVFVDTDLFGDAVRWVPWNYLQEGKRYGVTLDGPPATYHLLPADPERILSPGFPAEWRVVDGGPASQGRVSIPGRIQWPPVRAAAPVSRGRLMRVGLEAYWQKKGASETAGCPHVNLYHAAQAGLQDEAPALDTELAPIKAVTGGDFEPVESLQRSWQETRGEFTDLIVEVGREPTKDESWHSRAEVVGVQLELEAPTHRRRG